MRGTYSRTFARAAELLGSCDALARRLGVAPRKVDRWIGGLEDPPVSMFLAAVDIIESEERSSRGLKRIIDTR